MCMFCTSSFQTFGVQGVAEDAPEHITWSMPISHHVRNVHSCIDSDPICAESEERDRTMHLKIKREYVITQPQTIWVDAIIQRKKDQRHIVDTFDIHHKKTHALFNHCLHWFIIHNFIRRHVLTSGVVLYNLVRLLSADKLEAETNYQVVSTYCKLQAMLTYPECRAKRKPMLDRKLALAFTSPADAEPRLLVNVGFQKWVKTVSVCVVLSGLF